MYRESISQFAERFQHPAWGINHFKRVYSMSLKLAEAEKVDLDEEAIFAAAFLHDMGAFEPFKDSLIDHADRSTQLCVDKLLQFKFPAQKIALVKDIIEHHMFYSDSGTSFEAVVFRDADMLDFMGYIGITRMLSIVELDNWTPNLKSALDLIYKFSIELPEKLITSEAKKIGYIRKAEMEEYLKVLSKETEDFKYL